MIAKPRDVPLALVLILIAAQQYGSPWRAEYEKERNGPHGECRVDWQQMAPGLDYRRIECLGDPEDVDLHVVRVDQQRWRLDVASIPGGSTAQQVADEKDAGFVINASFFDHRRDPLGALVRSGDEIQRARSTTWQSIFLIDADGTPQIITPDQWSHYRKDAWMAVQAGPRLVTGGHTNRVHQSYPAARAGVCIAKSGDLLFFATPRDRKFDMYEITRIARRGETDGGLECQDAMLFDGGHSVQIVLEGDSKRLQIRGDRVPVFVYATRR